ncbi:MAG: glycosyltransferase [Cytophagaceae bacterium]|nr:glycosyltransferase [Cytophagaceae bacterium]
MKQGDTYLSIIIPSYRSVEVLRKNLPVLFDYLKKQTYTYEVIIVDDGSDDKGETERVALESGCRFVKNPVNMGKGAALKNGMLHAKGKFRIFTDADIPYKTNVIEKLLHYLDFKEFHMVVGDRTLTNSSYFRDVPFLRSFGSRLFSNIVGKFITTGIYDTQCGIKGFRAEIAEDLFGVSRIKGFTIDVELFYIAFKRNYDIKRLPVELQSQDGNSVNVFRHGMSMLFDLPFIIINKYKGKYEKRPS